MKKQLKISRILVYYDYPHVFTAVDEIGTAYLCLLSSLVDNEYKYITTAISTNRLIGFLNGSIDLRSIFEKPEIKEWYIFNEVDDNFSAELWEKESLPDEYLPDNGFSFKIQELSDEIIVRESLGYNNAVVHLAVSDEYNNYSINANDLGDVMNLYQAFLEYTYKKELRNRNLNRNEYYSNQKNYKLRAFASSNSSFNVHLFSSSEVDIFGNTNIDIVLNKVNELISDFENEELYINNLRSVKGHSISWLKRLVKKIIDDNLTIKHKWYSPSQEKVNLEKINPSKANKIFEILNSSEELSEESKEFIGYFVQVDVEKGTWRIYNREDKKEYRGEAQGNILQGITVETVNYKIECTEIIEEMIVSEKENIKYVLKTIQNV